MTPRPLVIQTEGAEKYYDGLPLSNHHWNLDSGTLIENDYIVETMNAQRTIPGTTLNAMSIQILNSSDQDVTPNYTVTYMNGDLVVTPRPLAIQTSGSTKMYDGLPLDYHVWDYLSGTLMPNHRIETVMNSYLINAGSTLNEIHVTILDEFDLDVTSYYDIDYTLGDLTVVPRAITIQTGTSTKVYDGLQLGNDTYTLTAGSLLDGHHLEAVMNTLLIFPGTVDNGIGVTILDASNLNVTSNYNLTLDLGTLTVTPIPITIGTESLTKPYDGLPLTSDVWFLGAGVLMEGDTISAVMESEIIYPGSTPNLIGVTILDALGMDVTSHYDIDYALGNLTVTPIPIIVKSESATKVYDGLPLTCFEWSVLSGETLPDHTIFVDMDAELTDIGTIQNTMYAYVLNGAGENVSSYYAFQYNLGNLNVLSSIYSTSTISTEPFEVPPYDAFQILTSQTGVIYFRQMSFGDYDYRGFQAGVPYSNSILNNPFNFASSALSNQGMNAYEISVEYLREGIPYLLPNFATYSLSGHNDIYVTGDTTQISTYDYIPYNYQAGDETSLKNTFVDDFELTYRQFVYDHYLDVPQSTLDVLLTLASENGILQSSPSLVSDIQNYIQNAATYDMQFAAYPADVEDVAVYFLTVAKEGICQHFATAATLMFRAFGIPARYTVGYVAVPDANQWTVVTGDYAHAWVEIYIDGFGWMPIEVTGAGTAGGAISGGSCGSGGSGGDSG
ncbi:MAG: transglutaminase domain-containing protein, partial [Candidatus Izemoplasmatales bacterium]|nr:transglutaminase domain-containing protein [Candidatus Izemoplasmatales bacterium]